MNDIESKVYALIARVAQKDPAALTSQMQLVADLAIDSPRALQLLCALEDELHIEVPEDAVARLNTVGDVCALVSACKAGS